MADLTGTLRGLCAPGAAAGRPHARLGTDLPANVSHQNDKEDEVGHNDQAKRHQEGTNEHAALVDPAELGAAKGTRLGSGSGDCDDGRDAKGTGKVDLGQAFGIDVEDHNDLDEQVHRHDHHPGCHSQPQIEHDHGNALAVGRVATTLTSHNKHAQAQQQHSTEGDQSQRGKGGIFGQQQPCVLDDGDEQTHNRNATARSCDQAESSLRVCLGVVAWC